MQRRPCGKCLLLAQSGHHNRAEPCPLFGVKQTSQIRPAMPAYDPLQTSALEICCSVNRLPKPFVGWSVGNFNPVAR
jgi:hypothetical protein